MDYEEDYFAKGRHSATLITRTSSESPTFSSSSIPVRMLHRQHSNSNLSLLGVGSAGSIKSPASTPSSLSYRRDSHQIYRVEQREKRLSNQSLLLTSPSSIGTTPQPSFLTNSSPSGSSGGSLLRNYVKSKRTGSFDNALPPPFSQAGSSLPNSTTSAGNVDGDIFNMDALSLNQQPFETSPIITTTKPPPTYSSVGTPPIPIQTLSSTKRRSRASFTFPVPGISSTSLSEISPTTSYEGTNIFTPGHSFKPYHLNQSPPAAVKKPFFIFHFYRFRLHHHYHNSNLI